MSERDYQGLQVFSIGRVVSETFGVIGRNALAIGLVAGTVEVLGHVVGRGGLGLVVHGSVFDRAALASVVSWFVSSIAHGVAAGAITLVAVGDLDGQSIQTSQALRSGLRLALPLAMLSLLQGLGIGIGLVCLLVPGLVLAMRWFVASAVRAVEGPGLSAALSRSAALTAGSRWKLFALTVVVTVLSVLLQFGFVLLSAGMRSSVDGTTLNAVRYVAELLLGIVTTSLFGTGLAVCYVELRAVKDGALPRNLAAVFS